MSLSRKHFVAIAQIVKDSRRNYGGQDILETESLIDALADYFASQNPNFDFCKFEQACNDDGGQDD